MGKGARQEDPEVAQACFDLPPIPSQDDTSTDPQASQSVWDVIVVGAGVAGAALAHQQGLDGRRVLLLERDLAQPDRIVGELLQPGGVLALERLGLGGAVDGIDAQPVVGYCMFKGGREARIAYPTPAELGGSAAAAAACRGSAGGASAAPAGDAPVTGFSFHNGRFVQRLRAAAAAAPGVTLRRGTVRALVDDAGADWEEGRVVTGVRYRAGDGGERVALGHLTVVCDGMYSALRSKLAVPDLRTPSHFIGLKLHGCTLPHPHHGHVILADPSPILFYPISSHEVRCLVDYPGEALPSSTNGDLAAHLRDVVAPQVPAQLRPAFLEALAAGRVRAMANKQLTSAPLHVPGALLLGDAFNMRHPLTGGGMTVALADTALLCDMLRPLPDLARAAATSDATAAFYVRRKPWAATINTLANALYRVFCAGPGEAHEAMRSACFDYLARGGECARGPIGLLSGLNPRPSILAAHFFSVALFGVGRLLYPRPTLRGLWTGLAIIYAACCIIFPIIAKEGFRAVFAPSMAPQPRLSGAMRKVASEARFVGSSVKLAQ
ncbi:Squalene monooxygenase [Auxenochlorella protothecoides]|uniref:Squalene monooxygenase n=1 Tax=Auxenochlorella protothecoides TaxID=3075 RepID=A0A087SKP9_AUXPR|nr:Squalene monooxygenase [Auxenochlorella protothecoides]KFM26303.1 Squalene monooxygenase [Auxenochlorella protothecoides]RMZ56791.1 hypothetical protein APUTEX25_002880 [Auxenochlorella protothecoides]|eukprot:RMZ56791.1 hypothetical protein APUTEX25_002880 [Auxenochlorella protothecoides]